MYKRQGLLLSGFAIGAKGWSFALLNGAFGELTLNQFGLGMGGFLTLSSLVLLLAFGVARRGFFKGDLFVAASVIGAGFMLALFIAYPVGKALASAFLGETGEWSVRSLAARVGTDRVWSLSCLAGGLRCGVAWNTLFLGLLSATGTTLLGTCSRSWPSVGRCAGARRSRCWRCCPSSRRPLSWVWA